MKVTINYMAQIKQAAGVSSEEIILDQSCSPVELARLLADKHGAALRRILLNDQNQFQPTILVFVNDAQVKADRQPNLHDGDEVTFLSPIAGG